MPLKFPKPPSQKSERRARRLARNRHIAAVRHEVSKRDPRCRVCQCLLTTGLSRGEMHELIPRSRGRPYEVTFSLTNCLMLCHLDHAAVTRHEIILEPLHPTLGAEGKVEVRRTR